MRLSLDNAIKVADTPRKLELELFPDSLDFREI